MSICSRIAAKSFYRSLYHGVGTVGIGLALAGCSRGPSRVEVPSYDPSGSASRAMEMYDKDGDGFIADEELKATNSLKASMATLDQNKDGKVSEQEISARIAGWAKSNIGLIQINCQVTLDGTPLEGATVTFVPEDFMGGAILEAQDTTSIVGMAAPRIPTEKRPSADMPPGIQLGYYKVVISRKLGDSESIPAKYNEQTILGQEVSRDDPSINNNRLKFNLSMKSL